MGKLVRDKIPAIMEAQGKSPKIRVLEESAYCRCLEEKLDEEVREFHADKNTEELADILEVVYALAESLGVTKEELLRVYKAKHAQRGGFRQKIFLLDQE